MLVKTNGRDRTDVDVAQDIVLTESEERDPTGDAHPLLG